MTRCVVGGFESVDIDIGGNELPVHALLAIDLAPDRGQPGATPACARQLVGPGILAVPGRLRAIFRGNLPIVAALRAIFRSDPTVDDGPLAAVGCLSAPGCGPDPFVGGALAVGGRPIPCASVEIAGGVIACLGRDITQLGGDVTVPRRQPSLAAAHCCQLIGPRVLAVPGRLGAVFGRHAAIVDGSFAALRRPSTPRCGSGAFVGGALAVGRSAIACRSIEVARRIVTRLGLLVTQLGCDVTIPRGQSRLPTA